MAAVTAPATSTLPEAPAIKPRRTSSPPRNPHLPPLDPTMAPVPVKTSPGLAPETRDIVREAVRASAAATLASPPALPARDDWIQAGIKFGPAVDPGLALVAPAAPRVLCCEEIDGRRWSYVLDDVEGPPGTKARRGPSLRAVPMQSPVDPLEVRSSDDPQLCYDFG